MEMIRCRRCNMKRADGPCLRCKWTPQRIRRERAKLKLTQDMFAHGLGVAWVTVARWEAVRGGSQPSKRNLALLETKTALWEKGGR